MTHIKIRFSLWAFNIAREHARKIFKDPGYKCVSSSLGAWDVTFYCHEGIAQQAGVFRSPGRDGLVWTIV